MYKYSKKAEDKFFKEAPLAFLFAIYSAGQEGIAYSRDKLFSKCQNYVDADAQGPAG